MAIGHPIGVEGSPLVSQGFLKPVVTRCRRSVFTPSEDRALEEVPQPGQDMTAVPVRECGEKLVDVRAVRALRLAGRLTPSAPTCCGWESWTAWSPPHLNRGPAEVRRKVFTETGYAHPLDAAHQQLGGPIVLDWDNPNTHVSRSMRQLISARLRLTVYRCRTHSSSTRSTACGCHR
ncbi:hypothetical protein ACFW5I_21450 [Streptomyces sp. NPDC058818]|uniref:hypothetical protein n=1 Tax=Streptomyces sp. NPDC058818 TaxID=3346640 RepID=UPI0036C2170A